METSFTTSNTQGFLAKRLFETIRKICFNFYQWYRIRHLLIMWKFGMFFNPFKRAF